MVSSKKTLELFVGAWSVRCPNFLLFAVVLTIIPVSKRYSGVSQYPAYSHSKVKKSSSGPDGNILPDWHSPYPSGMVEYTPSGYHTVIITANDTTEAEKRPKELTLPAKVTDPDSRWALVGKYSLAFGGPFNVDDEESILTTGPYTTATLPSYIGQEHTRNYSFHENGQVLHSTLELGGGYRFENWYKKLPAHYVFSSS